jgi:hypothetical protein
LDAFTVNEILVKQKPDAKFLNLILVSDQDENLIIFDGFGFSRHSKDEVSLEEFVPLGGYARNQLSGPLSLNRLTSDWDIFFIYLSNGDIFQIFCMMDDETRPQMLQIFRSFLPGYKLAFDRMDGNEDWDFSEQ